MDSALSDWLRRISDYLASTRHRGLLVIAGPADWAREQGAEVVRALGCDGLWVGESASETALAHCQGAKARQWLGRDLPLIVWDSHGGTHPSGLGAITGALNGGGLFVWLVPPLKAWAHWGDPDYERLRNHQPPYRFLSRLAQMLASEAVKAPNGLITPETQTLPAPPPNRATPEAPLDGPTVDQEQVVQSVVTLAEASEPAPLVLRADRGRGKSAALGMAVTQLAHHRDLRMGVSASGPGVLASFWRFVPETDRVQIVFYAPDDLLAERPELDLLIIDEAATLPVSMLEALVRQWPRTVMATTVHGYEGTGRGFDVRFRAKLDALYPRWQRIELTQPIRWAPDDPLEALMNRLLCLDAELPTAPSDGEPAIEPVSRERLMSDESLLADVMGLLTGAHYQTAPEDLRQLLDDPDTRLYVARVAEAVVGVVWVLNEGGLDESLAREVWLGKRRPRGHLMAQSLAFQGGDPEVARLRYARVTRIAVHPQHRRQGIGRALLAAVEREAIAEGIDVLGTSFGATVEVLEFWRSEGFHLLRLGTKRDAASGTHAVMLARALTDSGEWLCEAQRRRFAQHWPWLASSFRRLEPALSERIRAVLLQSQTPESGLIDEADRRELYAFIHGHRELDVSRLPLSRLDAVSPGASLNWSDPDRRLWRRAVVEGAGWDALRAEGLVSGRKPGLARLRALAGDYFGTVSPPGL